ncbi:MAG: FHA domain-containing protein [Deltaproteobacteria bacterium]|nr:FHA domain-containing protein [Deltaproteobacteria bacterium]
MIGRSSECDIRLSDASVSRRHARVFLDYGDPAVEDLNTPNGTLVNGQRIQGTTRLKAGDLIQIASERVRVVEVSPLDDYVATTSAGDRPMPDLDENRPKSAWDEPLPERTPPPTPAAPAKPSGPPKLPVAWIVGAGVVLAALVFFLIWGRG